MGQLHELRLRSNAFVAKMDQHIEDAILSTDYLLLDLNREQMKERQVTSEDTPIMPEYSPHWKQIKGLKNPNLYATGQFQKKLKMDVSDSKYLIKSQDWKNEKLTNKYKGIFGIAPSNQPKAKQITFSAFSKRYLKDVFQR
jgi:hypothetical protein